MHVAKIERRHGERAYTYWLVRRSVREGKRVRHETVANVSKLPAAAIEALRRALAGEALVGAGELFATERSLPHGHVRAVLAVARKLGLPRLLDRTGSRERARALAMIVQRCSLPARSSPVRGGCASRPWPRSSSWQRSTPTSSTPLWTGWGSASRRSRRGLPAAT